MSMSNILVTILISIGTSTMKNWKKNCLLLSGGSYLYIHKLQTENCTMHSVLVTAALFVHQEFVEILHQKT